MGTAQFYPIGCLESDAPLAASSAGDPLDNWMMVDDPVGEADDDGTYVEAAELGYQNDRYLLSGVMEEYPKTVQLHFRFRGVGSVPFPPGQNAEVILESYFGEYEGQTQFITTYDEGWADVLADIAAPPGGWTPGHFELIMVKLACKRMSGVTTRVTQVYLEITTAKIGGGNKLRIPFRPVIELGAG
jgi:hypothetical protein